MPVPGVAALSSRSLSPAVSRMSDAGTISKPPWGAFPTRATTGMTTPRRGFESSDVATLIGPVDDGPIAPRFDGVDRRPARPAGGYSGGWPSAHGHRTLGMRDLGRGALAGAARERAIPHATPVQRLAPSSSRCSGRNSCRNLEKDIRGAWRHAPPGRLSHRGCRHRHRRRACDGKRAGLSHGGDRGSTLANRVVSPGGRIRRFAGGEAPGSASAA